jgi:Nuclease subunit of the excinuclease complex
LHLASDSPVLHLIQQIRDEAHRFAITSHRSQLRQTKKTSILEQIKGVGPHRRRDLLEQLGGMQEVKQASADTLSRVKGISPALAKRIVAFLRGE